MVQGQCSTYERRKLMMTSEEKKRYNQKYILEEKDHAIKRIVALARDITAHGGGDIRFVKMEKKKK